MIDVEAVSMIEGQLHDLAAVGTDGVDLLDDDARTDLYQHIRRIIDLGQHLEVHLLGDLDESGATVAEPGLTTAQWAAHVTGTDPATARAQIKLARVLRSHLHQTDKAWLAGDLTRDHVKVLVDAANPRIRDRITDLETDLITRAHGRVFQQWKTEISDLATLLDEDGPDPTDPANTKASLSRTAGFAILHAQIGGEDAETIEQIIDHKIDELFRNQTRDREKSTDIPALTRTQLRGHAITELIKHGHLATASDKTIRAGVSLVLRNTDHDPTGWPSLTELTWTLTNPRGDHLILEHFATLLCGCTAHPFLVDADGNPLKLGLAVRLADTNLKRAAIIRDGGLCVFPGCDRKATNFHHVIRYENSGPTNIDNIAGLCPSHHGVTHRTNWSMHATDDHWFWWQTPSGHTFWSQRHGKQRAGPAPPPATIVV